MMTFLDNDEGYPGLVVRLQLDASLADGSQLVLSRFHFESNQHHHDHHRHHHQNSNIIRIDKIRIPEAHVGIVPPTRRPCT